MLKQRPSIKYRQLQYFLAVAESLHFSKAAEALFVTQPTLSHQLAELEVQVGTPLFDRAGKAVRLTQAGHILRDYAKRSLEAIDDGCTALAELEGLQRGDLRIGVTQSFIRRLMPTIIGEFRRRYPAIQLLILDMAAPQIERRLAEGELDLGIAFAPSLLEDTELEPILEDRLLLVVRRDHPFAGRSKVRMPELAGVPMVLLSRDYSTRQIIDKYFEQVGIKPEVACETNTIDLMIGLATRTDLAAIIPESAVSRSSEIDVLEVIHPSLIRISALMWPRHKYRSLASRAFAEIVRERFPTRLAAI